MCVSIRVESSNVALIDLDVGAGGDSCPRRGRSPGFTGIFYPGSHGKGLFAGFLHGGRCPAGGVFEQIKTNAIYVVSFSANPTKRSARVRQKWCGSMYAASLGASLSKSSFFNCKSCARPRRQTKKCPSLALLILVPAALGAKEVQVEVFGLSTVTLDVS